MKRFTNFYKLFEEMVNHRYAFLGCFINPALGTMCREFMNDAFPATPADAVAPAAKAAVLHLNGCSAPWDCFGYLWDTFSPGEKAEFKEAAEYAAEYATENFDYHNFLVAIAINKLSDAFFASDKIRCAYNAALEKAKEAPLKEIIHAGILYDTLKITPLSDPQGVRRRPRRLVAKRILIRYKNARINFWELKSLYSQLKRAEFDLEYEVVSPFRPSSYVYYGAEERNQRRVNALKNRIKELESQDF